MSGSVSGSVSVSRLIEVLREQIEAQEMAIAVVANQLEDNMYLRCGGHAADALAYSMSKTRDEVASDRFVHVNYNTGKRVPFDKNLSLTEAEKGVWYDEAFKKSLGNT